MVTIWHNPRCSKSQQTLALLQENGIEATIIEYLKTPPSPAEITAVIGKLGIDANSLVRKGERVFKELNLQDADQTTLINAMAQSPILIERPVVINGDKAAIGRPPEEVLKIF